MTRAASRALAEALPDEASRLAEQVDAVLNEALYWLPVRHHAPAAARVVREAIRTRRPSIVFIEGPSESQHLVPHVVDAATKPPLAIYSSFRDDDDVLGMRGILSPSEDVPVRLPSWYPLTDYSPEYVAMKTAVEVGADVIFIDLPHWALVPKREEEADDAPAGDVAPHEPAPPPSFDKAPLHELIEGSELLSKLAEAGGFRHWNEAWDTLFEPVGAVDVEVYRRELTAFCAGVRATTPPQRIEHDGTLARERFMWKRIQDTLRARSIDPSRAVCVCGGFHLFMERDEGNAPPPVPEGEVRTTLVPYSFPRLASMSGYAAGNRAPAWYGRLWAQTDGDAQSLVMEYAVDVLARARRKGMLLAAADTLSVVHHAHLLGQLRGRKHPVLDDVEDAVMTCCCKGDPELDGEPLRAALREIGTGTKVGRVTEAVGLLPLVSDYRDRMMEAGLEEVLSEEKLVPVDLDKRESADASRSALLHRLRYLGAPIGTLRREEDAFAQTIFKERWRLKWTPKLEPSLVEQSLLGDTVETAAAAKLAQNLADAQGTAGLCCRELLSAVDMDLTGLVDRAEEACGLAIDHDERFRSLVDAFVALGILERYAVYRDLRRDAVEGLLSRCYARACFSVADAAAVPEEEVESVVDGLKILADAVLRRDDLDVDLFAVQAKTAAEASPSPYLRGAFVGLLVEIRKLPVDELAEALENHARGNSEQQIAAGDFLAGALAVSRTALMLGSAAIVGAVDTVLRSVPPESFMVMVPRLRAAFEQVSSGQRLGVAEQVARRYGEGEEVVMHTLGVSVETAALLAELDAQVAVLLEGWSFE